MGRSNEALQTGLEVISMCFLNRFTVAFAVAAGAVCMQPLAKADTISVFSLSGNLEYGTVSGSITVDTTTGVLNAGSVTATYNGQSATLSSLVSSSGSNGLYTIELSSGSGGTGTLFYLDLPVSTLVNYTGGSIDTSNYNAANESYIYASNTKDYATSGTLNLTSTTKTTAVTPEVSSWVMMLTGAAMLVTVVRRRRVEAEHQASAA